MPDRQEELTALRRRARARIDAESTVFSAAGLADIEARYASAHMAGLTFVRRPDGEEILRDLVGRYPRANRAGCAVRGAAARRLAALDDFRNWLIREAA